MAHPWLQGRVPERSEIQAVFVERKAQLEAIAAEKQILREERKWAEKKKKNDVRRGCTSATDDASSDETIVDEDEACSVNVCEYGPFVHKLTNFFSTVNPQRLFRKVLSLLEESGVVMEAKKVRVDKLRLQFPVTMHS